jgi:hypothetical protein
MPQAPANELLYGNWGNAGTATFGKRLIGDLTRKNGAEERQRQNTKKGCCVKAFGLIRNEPWAEL